MKRIVGMVAGAVIALSAVGPAQAQDDGGYAYVVFSCYCDPYNDGEDKGRHVFISGLVSYEGRLVVPKYGINNQAHDALEARGVKMHRVGASGFVFSANSRNRAAKERRSKLADYRRRGYEVHAFRFSYYQD